MTRRRVPGAVRSLESAHAILQEEAASDWIGATEDQLGVSQEEHDAWLRTADESDLRDWARSVSTDRLGAESLSRFAISSPFLGPSFGDGGLE